MYVKQVLYCPSFGFDGRPAIYCVFFNTGLITFILQKGF